MINNTIVITGAAGQVGKSLTEMFPGARSLDKAALDITMPNAIDNFDWSDVKYLLNCAAFTNVDYAETPDGRREAWQVNSTGVANLVKAANKHKFVVVHYSTDYVFDGLNSPMSEEQTYSPLNVYGQSKASGDTAVSTLPRHYIIRASWVIGEGKNFVNTVLGQAGSPSSLAVVSDQIGRLTFTSELAKASEFILTNKLPYGTYNVTNEGEPASWAEIARLIYKSAGLDKNVSEVSTSDYLKDSPQAAVRPLNSTLDLAKITKAGFTLTDWRVQLKDYVKRETLKR